MNLVVSSITMVDLTNKEAKQISFHTGKNLLTSDHNHLGKSVVMKSIFHTLGAEVYYPAPIRRLNLLTYIDFSLKNNRYRIARLKNTFVLYCNESFVQSFSSVAEFEEKLCELFNLEINLVGKDEDGSIVKCPPAYYYMPYYVDQENGWSPNSYSFDRMTQFDLPQRKNSYFFHLGVLDSEYVEISKRQKSNDKQISLLTRANDKYRTVIDTLQDGLDATQMSFDIETLEKAIHSRQNEIKKTLSEISATRAALLKEEDHKSHLEHEKEVLSKYIKKTLPSHEPLNEDLVECPRCGTVFDSSTARQLEKLYLIESLHDEYTTVLENLVATERRINRLTQKFKTKQQTLKDFEGSLKADRETYNTYVKSKATKQLLEDYRKHISQNLETIERLRSDNTGFRKHLEAYKKDLASVNKSYLSKLGLLCVGLDIPADQIEENSEPGSAIIASGAYGPRCKVAQILAFVETKQSSAPDLISFPIVIDSPNALEQDDEHLESVIRTLLTWDKTDNQIIVASIQGKETAKSLENVNIITLENPKNHLFNSDDYVKLETEIAEIFTKF